MADPAAALPPGVFTKSEAIFFTGLLNDAQPVSSVRDEV